MPARSSRCSRSPPPWSTCASSTRRRISSALRTAQRCRTSRPLRRCPCYAAASTWPPALAAAAADGHAALAIARTSGAHGYAATAHSVLAVVELRRGDLAAAAQHLASRPAGGPQFADLYARAETTTAEAQITEARDGPAAALGHLCQRCADLEARPGLLLGDPALAAWLARTALAAGDSDLAARATRTAQELADTHPGFPALAAAAAHSRGLARRDPGRLAEAAAQHPDPWARASAAEDLGVLHGRGGDRDQAIHHLKDALAGYRQVGAVRDQARIRQRLRKLGIRRRHWSTPAARPVTGWDSLTDTEQAVAGLVAQGLNNNQAAARMYISTHTVAHHLRQAFRKLGIASRVELTRIVIEQAADGSLALIVYGRLPTRAGVRGLLPQLLRHAHGHLIDPGHELYRPRQHDCVRSPPGRGNALVRSGRPIRCGPDASATQMPGIHAGPGTRRSIASASATCAVDGPDDEIGKNRSGSADRQAAEERQCWSTGSVMNRRLAAGRRWRLIRRSRRIRTWRSARRYAPGPGPADDLDGAGTARSGESDRVQRPGPV